MRLFFIFFLQLSVETPALANNKVGNGGNVVVCARETRLLDFYENDLKPSSKGDPIQIAEEAVGKVSVTAPKIATLYREKVKGFLNRVEFKEGIALTALPDSLHLFSPLPKSCRVEQIAIRRAKPIGGEKDFLIRKDLWDQISPADKAGLILHEVIYEHLSALGETDSRGARKLNAYFFSSAATKDFWRTVKELRVSIYP
jgi:hypothetical protein